MKRILILSHTGNVSDFKIGSHHYANVLASKNYEVHYSGVPRTMFHRLFKRQPTGSNKLIKEVKFIPLKALFPITIKYNLFLSYLNTLYDRFFRREVYYDLILCDYPFFLPYLTKIKYGKLIYRPTDDYYTFSGDKVVHYEKLIIQMSDLVISTSSQVKESLWSRYSTEIESSKLKIEVISNGYDDSIFKKTHSVKERKNAVYVGAIDGRFDFLLLQALANKYKFIFFNIYGPYNKDYDSVIKDIVHKHANVIFHGPLEYGSIPKVLNEHKVGLLLLSKNDSNKGRSPMKLWEYLACGLNVFCPSNNVSEQLFGMGIYNYTNDEDALILFKNVYTQPSPDNDSIFNNSWQVKVERLIKITGLDVI
ncbi:glycosyltransferase family protein [Klebsiella quasipneumoniae]|uniref:Glycosyltransferase n=1 Tax=Klebsiella pneumoniae TaxID=573 RepID=A0A1C3SZQ1_KLEPN|nr:hypothetical protein [Klebsiella quasipneumoniae]SCA96076.1 glycosyltransferase [Klebsiella pneumoniae]HCA4358585.1 hypothetical protein [Klebsiella quasipneumoniae subsp. similipneumoniae]KAA6483558.1 hypothetical protein EHW95_27365 [Klebsiella quasipneumoniae]MDR4751508.1 hypothetical protein [Klebsiella quasipneumoniae]MDR4830520.1 hypothetical protein [Klebsiella quasipneumoniae]